MPGALRSAGHVLTHFQAPYSRRSRGWLDRMRKWKNREVRALATQLAGAEPGFECRQLQVAQSQPLPTSVRCGLKATSGTDEKTPSVTRKQEVETQARGGPGR